MGLVHPPASAGPREKSRALPAKPRPPGTLVCPKKLRQRAQERLCVWLSGRSSQSQPAYRPAGAAAPHTIHFHTLREGIHSEHPNFPSSHGVNFPSELTLLCGAVRGPGYHSDPFVLQNENTIDHLSSLCTETGPAHLVCVEGGRLPHKHICGFRRPMASMGWGAGRKHSESAEKGGGRAPGKEFSFPQWTSKHLTTTAHTRWPLAWCLQDGTPAHLLLDPHTPRTDAAGA